MRVLIACLWFTATTLDGGTRQANGDPGELLRMVDDPDRAERWQRGLAYYARHAEQTGSFEARNDHAAALMRVGRTDEAIAILEALEAEQPGNYYVAANLGTAYELAGRLDDALTWIELAIERNPDSHAGSEWVHVAILKAEIALRDDPRWLETHGVLRWDFGSDAVPKMPLASDSVAERPSGAQHMQAVARSVTYQLQERIPLVQPPNAVVADLLVELAAMEALSEGLEFAVPLLELSQRYGPTHPDLVEARLAHHRELVAVTDRAKLVGKVKVGGACFAAFAAWCAAGFWVIRRLFGSRA